MHEVSLVQELLTIAGEVLDRAGGTRIARLRLRVGALSGVEPDALQFAFAALKPETPAAHAELEIDAVPLRLQCTACATEFDAEASQELCPRCGDWRNRVLQGHELELATVEILCDEDAAHVG